MSRFEHLTTGSPVVVSTRGHGATRTPTTVERGTSSQLFVDGAEFRRCDGRLSGSAYGDHRCPRLEVL